MSAYISRVSADKVEVLSDAAVVESGNFTLTCIAAKCIRIPDFSLALTGRGDVNLMVEYGGKLSEFAHKHGTVDEALVEFAYLLSDEDERGRKYHFTQDFLIAGWSESEGAFHRLAIVGDEVPSGFDAFELKEISAFWAGGTFSETEFAEAGFNIEMFDTDFDRSGVDLMQAWRRKPVFAPGNLTPICGIGGQINKTTITKVGVKFETLGLWPDAIGARLDPNAEFVIFGR
jgi:hypothetical protein